MNAITATQTTGSQRGKGRLLVEYRSIAPAPKPNKPLPIAASPTALNPSVANSEKSKMTNNSASPKSSASPSRRRITCRMGNVRYAANSEFKDQVGPFHPCNPNQTLTRTTWYGSASHEKKLSSSG